MVPQSMDSNLARAPLRETPADRPRLLAAIEAPAAAASAARELHLGPPHVAEGQRLSALSMALRIAFGVAVYAICAVVVLALLVVCLPSRKLRMKIGNHTGHVTGRLAAWLSGSSYHVRGVEHLDPKRPAIYVANHASILDIVLGIWLAPVGTVGVAKKEIVRYPFFGQYYWLSGHLRIDRKNARSALRSLRQLSALVAKHALSVFIWPEGQRSLDGRLRPFKRGAFRLALETRLPVVPVVIAGSHRAWPRGAVRLSRANVTITCLPAIDTTSWKAETLGQHAQQIEDLFAATLPADQKPLTKA